MDRRIRQRIRQRFAEHDYQTRLAIFAVVGIGLIVLTWRIESEPWRGLLGNFSVTFLAVALIQFLWDVLGGDYLEGRIDAIQRSTTLLNDLTESNIGIERLWKDRGACPVDPDAGLNV